MTGATTTTYLVVNNNYCTTTVILLYRSTADLHLLLRPLISSRRMDLTTPPAACLRTRLARCCCGQTGTVCLRGLVNR